MHVSASVYATLRALRSTTLEGRRGERNRHHQRRGQMARARALEEIQATLFATTCATHSAQQSIPQSRGKYIPEEHREQRQRGQHVPRFRGAPWPQKTPAKSTQAPTDEKITTRQTAPLSNSMPTLRISSTGRSIPESHGRVNVVACRIISRIWMTSHPWAPTRHIMAVHHCRKGCCKQ